MTKKDYIKIAQQFKNAYELGGLIENENVKPKEVMEAIIKDFAVMLKKDNPKFSEKKFNDYILS